MTSQGAGKKRSPDAPRRKPLWRRLNRHTLFALHVVLYVVGGIWIWTLNAPALDKQFDVLLWLTALCAHGVVVYRNRRIAFALHLLMFCAGNGAIWSTTARIPDKLSVTFAWVLVAGGVGLWLARRQLGARPLPAAPSKSRKPRKPAAPPPEPEWYEPPAEAEWSGEAEWYDEAQPYAQDAGYGNDDEPPAEAEPPKKRGRKKGDA